MRIVFHHSSKDREGDLANAFADGARRHGHHVDLLPLRDGRPAFGYDLACMVGVKSRDLWNQSRAAGQRTLMFDKGYARHRGPKRTWEYWRVSLDAQQPTMTTLMKFAMPTDRCETITPEIHDWNRGGSGIILAGSSAKYHSFHRLPDPTTWARAVVEELRRHTGRRIIYRPKPSWRDAVPIKGTIFSPPHEQLGAMLREAFALVTHGSNACVDAAVAGVPSIILGPGVAWPISSHKLKAIETPLRQPRHQWLANLAYHQFTEAEMASGFAWSTIGGWIDAE